MNYINNNKTPLAGSDKFMPLKFVNESSVYDRIWDKQSRNDGWWNSDEMAMMQKMRPDRETGSEHAILELCAPIPIDMLPDLPNVLQNLRASARSKLWRRARNYSSAMCRTNLVMRVRCSALLLFSDANRWWVMEHIGTRGYDQFLSNLLKESIPRTRRFVLKICYTAAIIWRYFPPGWLS